jgi:undecaprenyl-diphosphatase
MISPWHAVVLGLVEGLTEYLPVSSTGHLILAAHALGLAGEPVKTFEVVIQLGAVVAVLALYRERATAMAQGLLGRNRTGARLLRNLLVSFLPAGVLGLALHDRIKAALFGVWPVVLALAVGGIVMIVVDRWLRRHRPLTLATLDTLSWRKALIIGLAQALALWPGTSRSMVTMVAGLLVGLPPAAAAEYSFLLALPTLGAATVFDAASNGGALLAHVGWQAIGLGFVVSGLTAAVAIRAFIQYLTRRGLAPFGWYRLALAVAVWWLAGL